MKNKELIKQELSKLGTVAGIMCEMGPQSRFLDIRDDVISAVGKALDSPLIELMTIDSFTGEVDCGRAPDVTGLMHNAFMALGEGLLTDQTPSTTFQVEITPETTETDKLQRELYDSGIRSVLAHPIRSGVGTSGVLVAFYATPHGAGDNEHLIATIATQAASTLSCARAMEQSNSMLNDLAGEYQEMSVQATVDGLTGLVNHRTFQQRLGELCKSRSAHKRATFCLVMADVDHFKVYNDTHGHQMGDIVLRNVARALASGLRQTDFAARYGGEEFALVIKGVDKTGALPIAERIRRIVSDECEALGNVTVSMGVAEYPTDGDSAREVIGRADKALYRAKATGRNRVVPWGSADVEEGLEDSAPSVASNARRGILVVDEGAQLADALRECQQHTVEQVADITGARNTLRSRSFDVAMVTSEALPDGNVKAIGDIAQLHPYMPVILVTADSSIDNNREAMRYGACDVVVRPFSPAELPLLIDRNLERRRQERRRLTARGTDVLTQAIDALVAAVDSRDPFTVGHSDQVTELSVGIADHLKLAQDERVALEWAAKLHDIGRLGLPDTALNKGAGLTDYEWAAMREHPVLGSRIVGAIDELAYVSTIIRHHHERLDGSGYPDGLHGPAIPYLSRVIAVADTYTAMVSDRSYRGRMTPIQAMHELRAVAGEYYEPEVVEALYAYLVGSGALGAEGEERAA